MSVCVMIHYNGTVISMIHNIDSISPICWEGSLLGVEMRTEGRYIGRVDFHRNVKINWSEYKCSN
jgi:hypothetical protein